MTHALEDAVGRRYGPVDVEASSGAISRLVTATGDDATRWSGVVPPSFASVALFAVAPTFLHDPGVAPFTRSLIHTEQRFRWHSSVPEGSVLAAVGEVTGVRARGSLNLVTFDLSVDAGSQRWLDGTATFLMSDEAASEGDEEPEPPHDLKGVDEQPVASALPEAGTSLPSMRRSASRADLVRYAGATGDWNPIHWDHDAARQAGLPGVIVHGLLMAAWAMQAACRHSGAPAPLEALRLRFRRPLRPAVQAEVTGSVTSDDDTGADLGLAVTADGDALVAASARVTR